MWPRRRSYLPFVIRGSSPLQGTNCSFLTMSGRRSAPRASDKELFGDDCNACDLLGATAVKSTLGAAPPPFVVPSPQKESSSKKVAPTSESDDSSSWEPRAPPGIVEIGNAGWTTIHSFAAYYPDQPTEKQQSSAKNLIDSFSDLFPCRWCADDLREHVAKNPVRTESRQAFSQWTCEAHNHVNEKLGKPVFDCSLFDSMWRRQQASTSSSSAPSNPSL